MKTEELIRRKTRFGIDKYSIVQGRKVGSWFISDQLATGRENVIEKKITGRPIRLRPKGVFARRAFYDVYYDYRGVLYHGEISSTMESLEGEVNVENCKPVETIYGKSIPGMIGFFKFPDMDTVWCSNRFAVYSFEIKRNVLTSEIKAVVGIPSVESMPEGGQSKSYLCHILDIWVEKFSNFYFMFTEEKIMSGLTFSTMNYRSRICEYRSMDLENWQFKQVVKDDDTVDSRASYEESQKTGSKYKASTEGVFVENGEMQEVVGIPVSDLYPRTAEQFFMACWKFYPGIALYKSSDGINWSEIANLIFVDEDGHSISLNRNVFYIG